MPQAGGTEPLFHSLQTVCTLHSSTFPRTIADCRPSRPAYHHQHYAPFLGRQQTHTNTEPCCTHRCSRGDRLSGGGFRTVTPVEGLRRSLSPPHSPRPPAPRQGKRSAPARDLMAFTCVPLARPSTGMPSNPRHTHSMSGLNLPKSKHQDSRGGFGSEQELVCPCGDRTAIAGSTVRGDRPGERLGFLPNNFKPSIYRWPLPRRCSDPRFRHPRRSPGTRLLRN